MHKVFVLMTSCWYWKSKWMQSLQYKRLFFSSLVATLYWKKNQWHHTVQGFLASREGSINKIMNLATAFSSAISAPSISIERNCQREKKKSLLLAKQCYLVINILLMQGSSCPQFPQQKSLQASHAHWHCFVRYLCSLHTKKSDVSFLLNESKQINVTEINS